MRYPWHAPLIVLVADGIIILLYRLITGGWG